MSKIKMLRNLIGIENDRKSSKNDPGSIFVVPESTENLGIVRYLGEDVKTVNVGDRVYYGSQRESIRMGGKDILIMEETNIFAVVRDSDEAQKKDA